MALTNNEVMKKLRVALQLRDDDIVEILALVDYKISKSELGAFFRSESHPKYMPLHDQILRNFLNGLVIAKRGPMEGGSKKVHDKKYKNETPSTRERAAIEQGHKGNKGGKEKQRKEKPTKEKPRHGIRYTRVKPRED